MLAGAGAARDHPLGSVSERRTPALTGGGGRTAGGRHDAGPQRARPLRLGASAVWELDFWGRFRRATESARAQLLATRVGPARGADDDRQPGGDSYFALRSLDLQLEIAKRTLASRQESLQLTRVRESGGVTSLVDVRQAEQLVFGAGAAIADLERRIAQQENLISLLVGNFPSAVARGRALTDQPHAPDLPAGLPSDLLERRPDIQAAEQQIVAANAQIGVARANYFPSIALTGIGGVQSTALGALFGAGAGFWTAAVGVAQPVFTAGRTRNQVALAEARTQEATLALRRRRSRARSAKSRTRSSATPSRASSARSRKRWPPRRRTRGGSPTSATRAARPATSRCSTATRACSSPRSASSTPGAPSCRRSSSSIARSAAGGSRKVRRRSSRRRLARSAANRAQRSLASAQVRLCQVGRILRRRGQTRAATWRTSRRASSIVSPAPSGARARNSSPSLTATGTPSR